jgi:hypothetical protein
MTRDELIYHHRANLSALYDKEPGEKRGSLFNKIKPSDFGDLKFRVSHGQLR